MNINKESKVFLIGGHLTPALSLLESLNENNINNIYWIGTKYSQTNSKNLSSEFKVINDLKIPFINFKTGKIWRKWTFKTLFYGIYQLLLIPIGFFSSLFIILKYSPKLIIGFGGYLQFPFILWGKILGKYTVIHEQTTVIGKSNEMVLNIVNRVFYSYKNLSNILPVSKSIYTGNLLRKSIFDNYKKESIFNNDKPTVFVTGGNQGSNTINKRLFKILKDLLKFTNVIHQVGDSSITDDINKAELVYNSLDDGLKSSYKYFSGDFSLNYINLLKNSDLIVSRAGANTISELLALGKMAIVIPIPWSSKNEQQKNAEVLESAGLGFILKQYDEMPPVELFNAIMLGISKIKEGKDFKNNDLITSVVNAKALVNKDAPNIIINHLFR